MVSYCSRHVTGMQHYVIFVEFPEILTHLLCTLSYESVPYSIVSEYCNTFFNRCFTASPRSLSREEFDLCTSTLDTMLAACTDNGMYIKVCAVISDAIIGKNQMGFSRPAKQNPVLKTQMPTHVSHNVQWEMSWYKANEFHLWLCKVILWDIYSNY